MLRKLFDFLSRWSSADNADAAKRIQWIGLVIGVTGLAIVSAEMSIGCAFVPRLCAPAVSIVSGGICVALLALLVVAVRSRGERWTVQALALGSLVALACLLVLVVSVP